MRKGKESKWLDEKELFCCMSLSMSKIIVASTPGTQLS